MKFNKYFNKPVTATLVNPLFLSNKGLTNTNYITNNGYVVKVYSNLVQNQEILITPFVKEFDAEVFKINTQVKITKFIEGETLEEAPLNKDKIIKIAQLIKRLHKKDIKIDIPFNPFITMKKYLKTIKTPMYDYSKYNEVIVLAEKIYNGSTKVLCHNDLTAGNFIFNKDKTYLIDWEYGGLNDPLYDVTSFLNENNIFYSELKDIFLEEYFKDEIIDMDKINIWNNFQNLICCLWANMMYEAKGKQIYIDIAKQEKEKLDKCLLSK